MPGLYQKSVLSKVLGALFQSGMARSLTKHLAMAKNGYSRTANSQLKTGLDIMPLK
jgi:hypothetical protein